MSSLTKSELDRMLLEAEADWSSMEEQRRIFDEAELEKQEIWAEYDRLQQARRKSRFGRLLRIVWGY